ncbi:MAG: thioredoxin-disulfide reductase [Bacteroidetes bacterium]|nr:MAG: thioredoxin-disulfide reductase [Bacteroidota bacterium]
MDLFKPMGQSKDSSSDNNELEIKEHHKCLILGSGPAGYTAAIYAARANLNPVMYTGMQLGGQLTTTTEVDNFPGYPDGIDGPSMMEDLKKQAERFGTQVRFGMATKVDFSDKVKRVVIDENTLITADSVILATGATAKYLGLESEEKFKGFGVSACATCDGFFYKNKVVAVVGGGDTAAEEASYLAGICKKVYLIVRRDELRASKAMQKRVLNTENIEVLWKHQTKELKGEQVVTSVELYKNKGEAGEELTEIEIDGFFLAIGHTPNSEVFGDFLDTDETGYVNTVPGTSKTNVPGIFACGDLQDKTYRQAVTAAGTGCMAALDAERYLGELD